MSLRCHCIWIALAMIPPAMAQVVSVELRSQASPTGRHYSLQEVADVRSDSARAQAEVAAVVIGVTPRAGQTAYVTREAIEARLGRALPARRLQIRLGGADAVTLRGNGQHIAAARIVDLAAAEMGKHYGARYRTMQLRPVGDPQDITVPQGRIDMRARTPSEDTVSKRHRVWIDIRVDDQPYRSVPVWFDAHATAPVLVAKASRGTGDVLRSTDLETAVQDVTVLPSQPLSPQALQGERLRWKRPAVAGAAVLRDQVEARPAVLRNEPVSVIVTQGSIAIETAAIALADAHVGERVMVRNAQSKEHYSALVVSEGAVTIDGR